MRTTITIDDDLLTQVKQRAVKTGQTVSQAIEDAVRESLLRERHGQERSFKLTLPTWDSGGWQPGVDLDNNAALLDLMEDAQ